MKKLLSILIFAILICSCNQNQMDMNEYSADNIDFHEEIMGVPIIRQDLESPTPPPLSSIENKDLIKKRIIKDGRIGLEVKYLEKTKLNIDKLIKKYDGYYSNENLNNTYWETAYDLKIRVPSIHFENLIADIELGGAEIIYKSIEVRDVTDQFIDLDTRLTNKKNYLNRYNDLLTKAKTVKDILEIEENIRGIVEEIESTTGRLKYLIDLVDYSTLDLRINKPKDTKYQTEKPEKFTKRIKYAVSKGWIGFVDFIVFVIRIWPFWIIITLIIYTWRKYKKKSNE